MPDYTYRRDLLPRIAIIGLVFGLTMALPNPMTCSHSDFTLPLNHADGPETSGQWPVILRQTMTPTNPTACLDAGPRQSPR
jgi:hypothetical protein